MVSIKHDYNKLILCKIEKACQNIRASIQDVFFSFSHTILLACLNTRHDDLSERLGEFIRNGSLCTHYLFSS